VANRFRKHPQADRDLDSIWSFIASDSVRAADKQSDRIVKVFEMLVQNPLAGRERPELVCAAFPPAATSFSTFRYLTASR
jgi:toxin ParE1/3/4